jgi:group I intron endonuclease
MLHFVYITTNLINGKQYVGDHSTNNLEKDKYLGSGKTTLKFAIKKYGKINFKREILEFFPTRKEAFDAQEKYIIKYNTLTPNGYNISPKGGSQCSGGVSEETKKRMSIAKLNQSIETKEKISQTLQNHPVSYETREKIRKSHTGKKQSTQTKEKKHLSMLGKNTNPKSEKTKEKISLKRKGKPSNFLGKTHSAKTIEEMKITRLGKKRGPYNKNV